jgi:hypothetical protein
MVRDVEEPSRNPASMGLNSLPHSSGRGSWGSRLLQEVMPSRVTSSGMGWTNIGMRRFAAAKELRVESLCQLRCSRTQERMPRVPCNASGQELCGHCCDMGTTTPMGTSSHHAHMPIGANVPVGGLAWLSGTSGIGAAHSSRCCSEPPASPPVCSLVSGSGLACAYCGCVDHTKHQCCRAVAWIGACLFEPEMSWHVGSKMGAALPFWN